MNVAFSSVWPIIAARSRTIFLSPYEHPTKFPWKPKLTTDRKQSPLLTPNLVAYTVGHHASHVLPRRRKTRVYLEGEWRSSEDRCHLSLNFSWISIIRTSWPQTRRDQPVPLPTHPSPLDGCQTTPLDPLR